MFGQDGKLYHHTLLLRSARSAELVQEDVFSLLDLQQVTLSIINEEKLTIDHVRDIQEMTYRKDPTQYSVYIIRAAGMSPEAQNGLLKIIEEPPVGTYFIFVTTESTLLPTFLSRSHEVTIEESVDEILDPQEFITMGIPARLEFVTELLTGHKKGEVTRQEIMQALGFLTEFLISQERKDDARRVFDMTQTLNISSGSLKQVLEGVSVMV